MIDKIDALWMIPDSTVITKKLTQCHLENDPGASPADVLYLRRYCEGRGGAGFPFRRIIRIRDFRQPEWPKRY